MFGWLRQRRQNKESFDRLKKYIDSRLAKESLENVRQAEIASNAARRRGAASESDLDKVLRQTLDRVVKGRAS